MLVHPAYFGPVIQYVGIVNAKKLSFEINDHYQKQSYRNRCVICGPNGKQILTVPIVHTKTTKKQKTKEIRIDNSVQWQKIHNKALYNSYRSSPFFEFYIDDLKIIFEKKYEFLLDLNLMVNSTLFNCMEYQRVIRVSDSYEKEPTSLVDSRGLINAKRKVMYPLEKYIQVFDSKNGFIPNLSILDLLFNEGPNTLYYLERHKDLLF
jgi:hypothetical protein